MDVKIEFTAGYKAEESPSWVTLDGKRYRVERVLIRERVQTFSGPREVFLCSLQGGPRVRLERNGEGPWEARMVRPD